MSDCDEDDIGEDGLRRQTISRRLEDELAVSPDENPKANNEEETMPEHMQIFLRIRPLNAEEIKRGESQKCIAIEGSRSIIAHAPKDSNTYKNSQNGQNRQHQEFTFSKVFNEMASQQQFFSETVHGTVKDFISGQNCLIFAYGVTNSGKTYTIQGPPNDPGVMPRALDILFSSIQDRQLEGMSLKPNMFNDVVRLRSPQEDDERKLKESILKLSENCDVTFSACNLSNLSQLTAESTMSEDSLMIRQSLSSMGSVRGSDVDSLNTTETIQDGHDKVRFSVWVSFAEIYNEYVYDLLDAMPRRKNGKRQTLPLREDKNGVPFIKGLKEIQVSSADEAYRVMQVGQKNLHFATTRLNHNSSRSHCIFNVKMLRVVDKPNPTVARISTFSFCDLAGAERCSKTQSTGDRIKEAGNINTSLLTLGRCIQALRNNQNKENPHKEIVPFRESKLTRIFQNFFTGKGRASMIVNINQCASTFDETLHALKYSAIAGQVLMVPEAEPEHEVKPRFPYRPFPRPSRLVSMVLANDPRVQPTRDTIGWASPKTLAASLDEPEPTGPPIRPSSIEEEDEEDTDTEDSEEVTSQAKVIEEMRRFIEKMSKVLTEERRDKMQMEQKLRTEISREFNEQLVQIEDNWTDRMRQQELLYEETTERRIEILQKAMVKNSSKKRKIDTDDESEPEDRSYTRIQSLEQQISELENELSEKNDMLENLKDATRNDSAGRSQMQQQNTELRFKIKDMEMKMADVQSVTESISELQGVIEESKTAMELLEKKLHSKETVIQQLTEQLESYKDISLSQSQLGEVGEVVSRLEEQVEEKQEEVTKLEQLIDLMRCESNDKDNQVSSLQEELVQAKTVGQEVEKLKEALTSTEQQLADRHQSSDGRQKEFETRLAQQNLDLEEKLALLEERQERCLELEQNLEREKAGNVQYQEQLNQLKLKMSEAAVKVQNSCQRLEQKERRINEEVESIQALEDELQQLEEGKGEEPDRQEEAMSEELERLREINTDGNEQQKKIEELQVELTQNMDKLAAAEQQLAASVIQSKDQQKKMEEIEVAMRQNKAELVAAEQQLTVSMTGSSEEQKKMQEMEVELTQKIQELEIAKQQLAESVTKSSEQLKLIEQMEVEKTQQMEKLEVAEQQLKNLNDFETTKDEIVLLKEKLVLLEGVASETKEKLVLLEGVASERDDYVKQVGVLQEQFEAANRLVAEKEKRLTAMKESFKEVSEKLGKEEKEVANLRSQVKQEKESMIKVGAAREDLEFRLTECQVQLEDYIIKVNEQAEEIGELKDAMKTKSEDADAKFEKQLDQLKGDLVEKEKGMAEKAEQFMVLESELENVKEGWKSEVQQLELVSDAQKIKVEQLTAELRDLENDLIDEKTAKDAIQKENREATEKNDKEQSNREEQLMQKLNELKLKLEAVENAVKEREQENITQGEELQRQLSGQKVSMEMQIEVMETERDETQALLEKTRRDLDCATNRITDLENEVKMLQSGQVEERDTRHEVEKLKLNLHELQQKLDDTDYKHQMAGRQAAREKAQVEKSLQEIEEVLKKRDEQLAAANEAKKELATARERVETLESALKDLETCLLSSKSSEVKAEELVDSYRQRCKKMEGALSEREDDIHSLKDQHCQMQKDYQEASFRATHLEDDLESLRAQVENECAEDLHERIDHLKEELANKAETEQTLRRDISDMDCELQAFQKQVTHIQEQKMCTEKLLEEKESVLSEAGAQCQNVEGQLEVCESRLQSEQQEVIVARREIEEKNTRLMGVMKQLAEKEEVCSHAESIKKELENKLAGAEKCREDAERVVREYSAEMERVRDEKQCLQERVQKVTVDLVAAGEAVSEVNVLRERLVSTESDLGERRSELESLLQQQESEVKLLQERLKEKDKEVESSISSSQDQLEDSRRLHQQVEKGLDREAKLREQLKEASRVMEDQNNKLSSLEDQAKEGKHKMSELQNSQKVHEEKLKNIQVELTNANQKVSELENKSKQFEENKNTLEEELQKKAQRLKTRNEQLNNFMEKMELERHNADARLTDAKANEMCIERLKEVLEEQDKGMAVQDNLLQERENDIKQISDELLSLKEARGAQTEESQETKRQLQQLKKTQQLLQEERDQLEIQLKTQVESFNRDAVDSEVQDLKHKLREATREVHKAERDRNRAEQDVSDTNGELRDLERKLQGRDEDVQRLQMDVDKLRAQEVESLRARTHERETCNKDMQAMTSLKTKFHTQEERCRQYEADCKQWKERCSAMEQQKAQELTKWREERDKLVGQLEKVLLEKDSQIQQFKTEATSSTKSNEIDELRQEIESKNEIIQQLSMHLDDVKSQSRTRGGGRRTRGSSSSDSDCANTDIQRRELESLHRQLQEERMQHQQDLRKVVRAKDDIIQEMRQQNQCMQHNLIEQQGGLKQTVITVADQHAPSDSDTPQTAKRARRPRKRKDTDNSSDETSQTGASKRGKPSSRARSSRAKPLRFDENEDPMSAIEEEGVIDLDEMERSRLSQVPNVQIQHQSEPPEISIPLTNSSNVLDVHEDHALMSPQVHSKSGGTRRKKRLHQSPEKPFAASPSDEVPMVPPGTPSAGEQAIQSVTRRLRTRRK